MNKRSAMIPCAGCGTDMPDDEDHVLYCDECQENYWREDDGDEDDE